MEESPWRTESARVIAAVLGSMPNATVAEKRKAVRAAYPFSQRRMHPYKVWLSEVRATKELGYVVEMPKGGLFEGHDEQG